MDYIATGIDTSIFYSIVKFLQQNKWRLDFEYDEKMFDKGIDFDLYQFSKDGEIILLAWDNCFEGEVKASRKRLEELSADFNFELFDKGTAYLHQTDLIQNMGKLIKFYS
ncbi:hypothetical protein ACLCDV_19025 [Sphingobacterium sp. Lzh-3]|jgi:hypothetical protein|uniref:hypothetical protein n=1 Tax=Sphingobacterium sp. Lzh-3 TaxID=3382150 RepID=UPI002830E44B|nr:hypothetical protein [Sphingobacterium sp.]